MGEPFYPREFARSGMTIVVLDEDERAWLHERIARRFDAMLAAGFLADNGLATPHQVAGNSRLIPGDPGPQPRDAPRR